MINTALVLAASTQLIFGSDLEADARRTSDPNGGYCTWNEDASDGSNARAWMRRCGRVDDEADCGTWANAHGYSDGECVWVPAVEWLSYDETGFPVYDAQGYAVLKDYAEMCGGKNADEECYECFECSTGGERCVPIDDCTPGCEVDDDCTREQICLVTDDGNICQLPNGPPKDNKSKRKGGKGNRGGNGMDSSEVFAQKVSLSVFEHRETSAVYYPLAMLALFVCALVMVAMRKLKNAEVKEPDMGMQMMHCVVDGQAVY